MRRTEWLLLALAAVAGTFAAYGWLWLQGGR